MRILVVLIAFAFACKPAETPADGFLKAIKEHCGNAYAGTIVANEPAQPNDPFADKELIMHVRDCTDREVKIPFHVGADRSRTWILTRTEGGLRLEHDHRHEDGTPDKVSMYGGDTAAPHSARRQEFPASATTKVLFEREGLKVSVTNIWAMEIDPKKRFLYELTRPGRVFRVEFDLTRPLPPPGR